MALTLKGNIASNGCLPKGACALRPSTLSVETDESLGQCPLTNWLGFLKHTLLNASSGTANTDRTRPAPRRLLFSASAA